MGSWLAARLQAGRPPPQPDRRDLRAVAVDGKAVRGTRHASGNGQARHLLAAADQQAGAVLAQAEVDGKTNEISAFAPLLARWTWLGLWSPPMPCTPSASTPSSWSPRRERTASWP